MNGTSSFILQILIGLIVSVLSIYAERILKKIITSTQLINLFRKIKIILLHIVISLLIWYFAQNYSSIKLIQIYEITIDPKIVFIIVLNVLIWLTRLKDSQINGVKFIGRKDEEDPEIEIYKLKLENKRKKLRITWETFGKGIEILTNAIYEAPGVEPKIVFGINEAGVIIASYMSYYLRAPLGVIKTGARDSSGKRDIIQCECPKNIINPNCIVVVDSEIKSGRSIKQIIDELKKEYENARIIYTSLAGVIEDKIPNNVCDFGWGLNRFTEKEYKPDFLAFYIDKPGFEPPGGIR